MEMWMIIGIVLGSIAFIVLMLLSMYRIVPASEAHLLVRGRTRYIRSTDAKISKDGNGAYFKFPTWMPRIGTKVAVMPLTVMESNVKQETQESGQARYELLSSAKYRIVDVSKAADSFTSIDELKRQLESIIEAAVRTVTIRYDIKDVRAKRKEITDAVNSEVSEDFRDSYGIQLVNFQLVEFNDTAESHIISDISKIREKEIEANRRQQNADRDKASRIKEAEADESAKEREIARDQKVGEYEQQKEKAIQDQKKIAEEARYKVVQVQTIQQAEIDKQKQIILANQEKETEEIKKEKKRLEGEGDRLMKEEQAKGEAAKTKEEGLAVAAAMEAKQEALKKFTPEAVRALVAEPMVEAYKLIGLESAKALASADVRIMSGGDMQAFNTGRMVESMRTSSADTALAELNNMARKNDLGFVGLFESLSGKQSSDSKDNQSKIDKEVSKK